MNFVIDNRKRFAVYNNTTDGDIHRLVKQTRKLGYSLSEDIITREVNMDKAKVLVLARMEPILREILWEKAPDVFELTELGIEASEQEIVEILIDSDFLIPLRIRIPDRALREARKLKLIQLFSQGYDRIQMDLIKELGIPVANIGGFNAISVAEHTVMLILALLRRLIPSISAIKEGRFAFDLDRRLYHQLYEKTVGIIGMGNIGKRIAAIVNAFGGKIVFYDPASVSPVFLDQCNAQPMELNKLLKCSDIVTLHVPLLEGTRGLINRDRLLMMKPSAVLINTSRGPVVDETALIRVLEEKQIAGAGLDVFMEEPLKPDSPLLFMDNVVTTPHIGGFSIENVYLRVDFMWQNIGRVWRNGTPENVVAGQ
ncbi:NAD(P)-dependent oxidoreductase [Thermodesulfobacteriota bacterium]